MSSQRSVALTARGLTKAYRIWSKPSSRIVAPALESLADCFPKVSGARHWLAKRAHAKYRDFFALRDVSFELRPGEAIGIVGRNGSGKSTLLQIVAGTLQPTSGEVSSHGRVAALLELGSGFNHEFTGRENVYLNASVLGLSRRETDEQFDSIAAFADIGEFIEEPVKTYSSGMVVRLAFAVAIHVNPEILIVDEALAVGDARFQLKCARAIDALLAKGVALLFVSHDLGMVKRLCSHAVLLEQGNALYAGAPNDVVNLYSKLIAEGGSAETIAPDIATLRERASSPATENKTEGAPVLEGNSLASPSPPSPALPLVAEIDRLRSRVKVLETTLEEKNVDETWAERVEAHLRHDRTTEQSLWAEYSYGGELGRILDAFILDRDAQPCTWFDPGEPIEVRMQVEALSEITEPIFALTIKDAKGQDIYGTNTLFSRQHAPSLRPGERRNVRFRMSANLMPGEYFVSLGFTQFVGNELVVIHRRYDFLRFSMHGPDRCFGIANCYATISVDPL